MATKPEALRRRAITAQAHVLAKLTERRREVITLHERIAVELAECDVAVIRATRDLLDLIARDSGVPLVMLCAGCHLTIQGEESFPGRYGVYHARCLPAVRHPLQEDGAAPEQECAS